MEVFKDQADEASANFKTWLPQSTQAFNIQLPGKGRERVEEHAGSFYGLGLGVA